MKKMALGLTLAALTAGAAFAYTGEDPKGYEGHEWGSQPTAEMRLYQKDMHDPTTSWYVESTDRIKIAGLEFMAPVYGYDKDWGLYAVIIPRPNLTHTGDELTDKALEKYLEENFGEPNFDKFRYMVRTRRWYSEAYPVTELQRPGAIDDWDVEWEFEHKWDVLVNGISDERTIPEGTNLTWVWGLGNNDLVYSSNYIEALRMLRNENRDARDARYIEKEEGKRVRYFEPDHWIHPMARWNYFHPEEVWGYYYGDIKEEEDQEYKGDK